VTPTARAELRQALAATAHDLLGYFERRSGSPEDAADLLGETMLQAWRRHDSIPVGDFTRQRMWLFTIAANVLSNDRRSRRRRSALTEELRNHLATSPTAPPLEEVSAVRDAVFRLRDDHRELVMLIHWDGFSIVEAARLLRLNESTARGRYAAARTALREALTDTADDPVARC
jgi:RNA polymerase sigma-70 factor (ECF subfamily)